MLDALRQRTVAKVLFDEHHGEAWSIRPEAAARMRPSHPAAASYAAAAAELTARDFAVATTTGRPLDEVALAGADVLVIAHPSDPKWERTVGGDSPRSRPPRSPPSSAFVAARRRPRRARRGRRGQVRRQPQRAARAVRRAVREHDRVRVRPRRRRAVLGRRRGRGQNGRARHPAPRATRRASTAPGRCPPTTPAPSCCARARPPTRPAPPWSPRRSTRRAASSSSPTRTSSATTTCARRDNRQLWLNLVYWASLARVPRRRDAHRLGGGAGPGVAAPQGRDRRAAPSAGARRARSTWARTTRARCARSW